MDVPIELFRVVISETSPQQFIFLREKGGERSFPILIGISEALAIHRRLRGDQTPRPMTHDLLANVISALGGSLERIVVTDLRDGTFIASLFIERGDEVIEVDSRPSDAIALGAALDTPLYVAEHVLEKVMRDAVDYEGQREALKLRREELAEQIDEVREQLKDGADGDKGASHELKCQLTEMQAELEAIDEFLKHLP
jgi:bifunctional DNase/RNase